MFVANMCFHGPVRCLVASNALPAEDRPTRPLFFWQAWSARASASWAGQPGYCIRICFENCAIYFFVSTFTDYNGALSRNLSICRIAFAFFSLPLSGLQTLRAILDVRIYGRERLNLSTTAFRFWIFFATPRQCSIAPFEVYQVI